MFRNNLLNTDKEYNFDDNSESGILNCIRDTLKVDAKLSEKSLNLIYSTIVNSSENLLNTYNIDKDNRTKELYDKIERNIRCIHKIINNDFIDSYDEVHIDMFNQYYALLISINENDISDLKFDERAKKTLNIEYNIEYTESTEKKEKAEKMDANPQIKIAPTDFFVKSSDGEKGYKFTEDELRKIKQVLIMESKEFGTEEFKGIPKILGVGRKLQIKKAQQARINNKLDIFEQICWEGLAKHKIRMSIGYSLEGKFSDLKDEFDKGAIINLCKMMFNYGKSIKPLSDKFLTPTLLEQVKINSLLAYVIENTDYDEIKIAPLYTQKYHLSSRIFTELKDTFDECDDKLIKEQVAILCLSQYLAVIKSHNELIRLSKDGSCDQGDFIAFWPDMVEIYLKTSLVSIEILQYLGQKEEVKYMLDAYVKYLINFYDKNIDHVVETTRAFRKRVGDEYEITSGIYKKKIDKFKEAIVSFVKYEYAREFVAVIVNRYGLHDKLDYWIKEYESKEGLKIDPNDFMSIKEVNLSQEDSSEGLADIIQDLLPDTIEKLNAFIDSFSTNVNDFKEPEFYIVVSYLEGLVNMVLAKTYNNQEEKDRDIKIANCAINTLEDALNSLVLPKDISDAYIENFNLAITDYRNALNECSKLDDIKIDPKKAEKELLKMIEREKLQVEKKSKGGNKGNKKAKNKNKKKKKRKKVSGGEKSSEKALVDSPKSEEPKGKEESNVERPKNKLNKVELDKVDKDSKFTDVVLEQRDTKVLQIEVKNQSLVDELKALLESERQKLANERLEFDKYKQEAIRSIEIGKARVKAREEKLNEREKVIVGKEVELTKTDSFMTDKLKELDKREVDLSGNESRFKNLLAENEMLKKVNASLQTSILDSNKKFKLQGQRLIHMKSNLDSSNSILTHVLAKNKELSNNNFAAVAMIGSLKEQISNLEKKNTELENELNSYKGFLENKRQEDIAKLRKEYKGEPEYLNKIIEQNSGLLEQERALNEYIASLHVSIEQNISTINELNQKVYFLSNQVVFLNDAIKSSALNVNEACSDISSMGNSSPLLFKHKSKDDMSEDLSSAKAGIDDVSLNSDESSQKSKVDGANPKAKT